MKRPPAPVVEDVGGFYVHLATCLIALDHARATSDRDLIGAYLRIARSELLYGVEAALDNVIEGEMERARLARELADVRDQLQRIGRKAFWASKEARS